MKTKWIPLKYSLRIYWQFFLLVIFYIFVIVKSMLGHYDRGIPQYEGILVVVISAAVFFWTNWKRERFNEKVRNGDIKL